MKPHCLCLFVLFSASSVLRALSSTQGEQPLIMVADVPLPAPAVRFDYQTFDPSSGRLYKWCKCTISALLIAWQTTHKARWQRTIVPERERTNAQGI